MPDWKSEIRARLESLRLVPAREAAIVEELSGDLEDCYTELLATGVSPAEAERLTRAELSDGGLLARELQRVEPQARQDPVVPGTTLRETVIGDIRRDLQYGARMLIKSPGFTAVAVISLALGIGANTAIFSLADKVMIRTLPLDEPDRLVVVSTTTSRGGRSVFTYPDFADYRAGNTVFDDLICYVQYPLTLSEGGQAERVQGMIVSGNYFDMLRVPMALGRGFLPEEDRTRGTHPVVVLSHGLWRRRFGADPQLLGRTVSVNAYSFTVVGIAPPEFSGTVPGILPDIYVPVMMQGRVSPSWTIDPLFGPVSRDRAWLEVLGRLKPGVGREQAAAAMTTLGSQIAKANPGQNGRPRSEPRFILEDGSRGHTYLLRDLTFPLRMLMGTVGLILLIACANIASLLLSRAGARQKEIAVRLALGASRSRLIRQLLTENLFLSMLGGLAGLALAASISGLVISYTPPNMFATLTLDNRLDWRVLGFTLVISLLTGTLFGLAPSLSASRPDLLFALKDETTLLGTRISRLSLRTFLVATQVALSFVVLIGAGLCIRSLQNLQAIDAGFDPGKVMVMSADVSLNGYSSQRGLQFYSNLLERLERLRGVEAASVGYIVPLGTAINAPLKIEGYAPQAGEDMTSDFNIVGPAYFRTMRIPVVQGREFQQADSNKALQVAMINEAAARRFWPGRNPIGQRLDFAGANTENIREIVGIVRDSKYGQLTEQVRPTVYVPWAQDYRWNMTIYVRSAGEPEEMLAAMRREVQALDSTLPVYNVKTLEEQKNSSLYASRLAATLLTVFGFLALGLAAVGLYGVLAFTVERRTHEIGIRLSLGAPRHEVIRQLMAEGMTTVAIGLGMGFAMSLAVTRLVRGFLYGVTATDTISFAGAALLLVSVALLANFFPARRASRTDPLTAIRHL